MKYLLSVKNRTQLLALAVLLSLSSCVNTESNAQDPENENSKKIKIALLLDTSNSMDGLIEQAKSQLWELVNELAKAECDGALPVLEIALYEYGNDNLSQREGYIRQVTPLTNDLDQISEDLFKLTTHGGSEFCGQVIQTAINQQTWSSSENDLQIIFIAGNEPFTQGNVSYKQACTNAREKGIIVNTIHCGSFDEGIQGMWKDGADLANGEYMCIEQDRKTVFIASPYDDRISALNKELNETYVGYGSLGKSKKQAQVMQDNNAQSYSKANYVKRAVSKSSHFYENSTWDLVDASKKKDFKVDEIKESELPEELKGKSTLEKEAFIKAKAQERERIQKDIQTLNKKRMEYVAEKQKEAGEESMLDKAMIGAIKKQAAEKEFKFK